MYNFQYSYKTNNRINPKNNLLFERDNKSNFKVESKPNNILLKDLYTKNLEFYAKINKRNQNNFKKNKFFNNEIICKKQKKRTLSNKLFIFSILIFVVLSFIFIFLFFYSSFNKVKTNKENFANNYFLTDARLTETTSKELIENFNLKKVEYSKYKVKIEDNITSIAKRFNLLNDTVILCNNIKRKDENLNGKILLIPNQNGRIVISPDILSIKKIASNYNISVESLLEINNLDLNNNKINDFKVFIPNSQMTKHEMEQYGNSIIFSWPLNGSIISYFGCIINHRTKVLNYHQGIDIISNSADSVKAVGNGTVLLSAVDKRNKKFIIIKHKNGYISKYCNLKKVYVNKGDIIKKQQKIAEISNYRVNNDSFLHLEFWKNGFLIDPLTLLNKEY